MYNIRLLYKTAGQLQTQDITGPGNYRLIALLFVLAEYDYCFKLVFLLASSFVVDVLAHVVFFGFIYCKRISQKTTTKKHDKSFGQ